MSWLSRLVNKHAIEQAEPVRGPQFPSGFDDMTGWTQASRASYADSFHVPEGAPRVEEPNAPVLRLTRIAEAARKAFLRGDYVADDANAPPVGNHNGFKVKFDTDYYSEESPQVSVWVMKDFSQAWVYVNWEGESYFRVPPDVVRAR